MQADEWGNTALCVEPAFCTYPAGTATTQVTNLFYHHEDAAVELRFLKAVTFDGESHRLSVELLWKPPSYDYTVRVCLATASDVLRMQLSPDRKHRITAGVEVWVVGYFGSFMVADGFFQHLQSLCFRYFRVVVTAPTGPLNSRLIKPLQSLYAFVQRLYPDHGGNRHAIDWAILPIDVACLKMEHEFNMASHSIAMSGYGVEEHMPPSQFFDFGYENTVMLRAMECYRVNDNKLPFRLYYGEMSRHPSLLLAMLAVPLQGCFGRVTELPKGSRAFVNAVLPFTLDREQEIGTAERRSHKLFDPVIGQLYPRRNAKSRGETHMRYSRPSDEQQTHLHKRHALSPDPDDVDDDEDDIISVTHTGRGTDTHTGAGTFSMEMGSSVCPDDCGEIAAERVPAFSLPPSSMVNAAAATVRLEGDTSTHTFGRHMLHVPQYGLMGSDAALEMGLRSPSASSLMLGWGGSVMGSGSGSSVGVRGGPGVVVERMGWSGSPCISPQMAPVAYASSSSSSSYYAQP